MSHYNFKKQLGTALALLQVIVFFIVIFPIQTSAEEARTVRVAFFPMDGFHTYSENDGYGGADADYLAELCRYTGWKIEYVECSSWNDALVKLGKKEVDLVGSAQYSEERAAVYDYAALSSGYTFGCLFVEEGSDLAFEDFDRMKDMTFGVVESYIRRKEFLDYLRQNQIPDPQIREYDTTQELQEALRSGQIDVAAHTLTEVAKGQCLVGKFAYAPCFYVTWKGNKSLLKELNLGIQELKMIHPLLEQELIARYYSDRRENFAADERNYIDQGNKVRIGFYKDTRPLAYINEQGEYDGIYIQIMKKVAERSGIQIEFLPMDRSVYWKDLLQKGQIDFYAGSNNMQLAQDEGIALTSSFMPYNAVIISTNDFVLSDQEVTLVLTKGRAYWADSLEMKTKVIYQDSAKDCLQALENGDADITLLNTIEYNYLSKNERFSNLIEWDNFRFQSGTALASSKESDPMLFKVMNKALELITEGEREDIINQYMNIPYESYELRDYVYQSKNVIAASFILLIFFLTFGLSISHMRRKSYHLLEKKNEELQNAMEEAERANQAKTEFLSHMSHDIRTPINGIMGMLNIAENNPEDPERQLDCREKIRTSAEHLLSLINDVLDISKLENGNVELASEVFSLTELLESCSTIIGGQASAQHVSLETDFSELYQLPHTYYKGSPLHIKQILINIAGNAVKYNKPEGSVSFRCHQVSEENGIAALCFEISDTGIGMSRDYLEHIFEPFTQEQDGARTNYQGTGLGMTITKRLVDKMGGSIKIESELDQGSQFTVILPLEQAVPPEDQKEDRQAEETDMAGKKVLLVEDNELNQEIACYMLAEKGLEITVAANGKEAVELFEKAPAYTFAMIFMDVMMPVMNGSEATKAIRALDRPDAAQIPVIAMTANAFAEDVKEALDAGMNEHMAKPLEPEVINRVLARWI